MGLNWYPSQVFQGWRYVIKLPCPRNYASSEILYTLEKDFNWQNKKVKALGVWLSTDPETTIKLNFVEKIEKMWNCMGCWSVRRLSLIGKITVLKVARLDFLGWIRPTFEL